MRQNADFLAMLSIMTTKLAECEAECAELHDSYNLAHNTISRLDDKVLRMENDAINQERHHARVCDDYRERLDRMRDQESTLYNEVRKLKEEIAKLKYGGETSDERANIYMAKDGLALANIINPKVGEGKIAVIKVVRELTGWGLKESKDFVCAYVDKHAAMKDEEVGSGTKRSQQLSATGH